MRQVNWPLLALFVVVWLILGQLFMGHAVHLVSNMGIRGDNFGILGFQNNFFCTLEN